MHVLVTQLIITTVFNGIWVLFIFEWLVMLLLIGHITGVAPVLKDLCTQNSSSSAQYIEFLADRDIDVMTRFGWSKRTRGNGSTCCSNVHRESANMFLFPLCLSLLSDHTLRNVSSRLHLKCWSQRNPTVALAICQKYLSFKLTVPLSRQGRSSVFFWFCFPVPYSPQMPHAAPEGKRKETINDHVLNVAIKNSALVKTA